MVLIADSGGSKIEWRLLRKNAPIEQAHTAGFNPYYQQPEDLHPTLGGLYLLGYKTNPLSGGSLGES